MKKTRFVILICFFFLVPLFAGCATEFSATGGPAVLANVITDLRSYGSLKTSPGGIVERNQDARLGALINRGQSISKDVEIFVQGEGNLWHPYHGPAEVYTPGWIKVWDKEKKKWFWEKLFSRWLEVDGLKIIHFESAFMQSVTLRLNTSDGIKEIMFDTFGREDAGDYYKRINVLFIKLPERMYGYKLNVYTYTGEFFFRKAKTLPYDSHIFLDGNPTDHLFNGLLVGWILYV